jgi:hypothetical protein
LEKGDAVLIKLKFPVKVSCREPHRRGGEGIFAWFAWKWANQAKILGQCLLSNESSDIGKGKLATP